MKSSKTCLLDAAAHILSVVVYKNPDYSPEVYDDEFESAWNHLADHIGHRGEERGFHSQELQDALREQYHIVMVRHELYPCMQLPPDPEVDKSRVRVIPIYSREDAPNIFLRKLRNDGILVIRKPNGVHHALGFQSGSNVALDVQKDECLNLEDLDVVMFLEFIHHENYPSE